jgi:UDP-glucuronate decarboxylase
LEGLVTVQVIANPIAREDLERVHQAIGRRAGWDGAVVVVTGCAGFLGFYLLQYLVCYARELGIRKVIGLDAFAFGKPNWLVQLAAQFPNLLLLREFDISRDSLGDIEEATSARYVLHGASVASPTFYRRFPLETIDANVWGLRRLLDFYKGLSTLKGLLFFSSSEVYGDPSPENIPTSEVFRGHVACVGPRACYDESKRFGETLCYVFGQRYGMPVTVVRPFNNYGPGMRLDDGRLPADLARSVVTGSDISILSDGSPTRTFCYVSDAVIGYLLCLLHGKYDVFNIGSDEEEVRIRDLAEAYRSTGAEVFGYSGAVRYTTSPDPQYLTDNPNRRCPDLSKARSRLGYEPQTDLREGVRRHLRFLKAEAVL